MILSLSRWDGEYSSTILSMAKVFARTNRVFYLDNPFTIRDVVTRFRSKQVRKRIKALLFGKEIFNKPIKNLPNFITITPTITFSINWLPNGKIFNFFLHKNDQIVYRSIRKTIRQYDIKNYIFINSFNPLYANHFPSSFKPSLNIYHCVDDIRKAPHLSKHGAMLEQTVISKADLVITTSTELARLKSKQSDNVHVLSNAANVSLFQRAAYNRLDIPPELLKIPKTKKIITYVGNICHRLDYQLLLKIADNLHDHILLMVGPYGTNAYKESGLTRRMNVIFAGKKKLEDLPTYLQYSHCCIIPFLCNTLTRSIYPLKINEYLSAGKPVVTTPFSEDIKSFNGIVCIANDDSEFIRGINESIKTDNKERRQQRVTFSASNNWEDRTDRFWEILADFNNGETRKEFF